MTRYDGLNLPQLLDLMHDIVRPEPVSWLPQTPGWWIVAAWLLAIGLLLAMHAVRWWRRNRYRRDALAELQKIGAQANADSAAQVAVLLKRTALAAYPRNKVAHLYGADWAKFIGESANHDALVTAGKDHMATAAYRKDTDLAALTTAARRWIRVHRV